MRQLKDLRQWGKMHGLFSDRWGTQNPNLGYLQFHGKIDSKGKFLFHFFFIFAIIFDELGKIINMEKIWWWGKKPYHGYIPKKFLETIPPLAGSS